MNAKKRYDKKVRLTRILLVDYLVLKQMSQLAGVSMAQALHRLIEHQAQLPLMTRVATQPALGVSIPIPLRAAAQPTLRVRPQPTMATNGSKIAAFRIRPKGARND
ncbi:hypothetical protein ES703_121582 [subsurface metagenome]